MSATRGKPEFVPGVTGDDSPGTQNPQGGSPAFAKAVESPAVERGGEEGSLDAWLDYIGRVHPKSIEMGLERVAAVRHAMSLEPRFPVVTVGGTNGKGSTCAMLEAILEAGGRRVGCYTSPHVLRFNERVNVDRASASDEQIISALARVDFSRGGIPLTFFEFSTLAAMQIFIEEEVDVAILEVGLGGRLDAVNAFDADCAAITSIAIDHVDFLGHTREAIGFEKAGIFRPGKPAICAEPDVPKSMLRHAEDLGTRLLRLGEAFDYETSGNRWNYRFGDTCMAGLPKPRLEGAFQLRNASAAITALKIAVDGQLDPAPEHVVRGIVDTRLAGRFQVVQERPLVVLDVAHNREAARSLCDNLAMSRDFRRTLAVFAMLGDKDIAAVIDATKPEIDAWFVADLQVDRGADAARLRGELLQAGVTDEHIHAYDSPEAAFCAALGQAHEDDRVVVYGSFHTVGAVLAASGARHLATGL